MNKNILITIIIVTYNAEKHIREALESLRTRINEKTEVIIIDGLSDDDTLKIINEYNIYLTKVVSEKDLGIYDAMNKGISMASGKFILFLGSDDQLVINLEELSNLMVDDKTIYYGDVILAPSNKIYGGEYNTSKLINRNICHQSIFYPKQVFDNQKFDTNYKLMADYVMNLKLWKVDGFKFDYLNKIISIYSLTGLSSTTIDQKFKKDSFKLIFKHFGVAGILVKILNPIRNFFNKYIDYNETK
ncbi:glycosyltransferase family 2 protein [Flavobacterium gawalongense]|uniref:Glycosyltransferase n=1 Tax=Flavobacterium gawalongense TaxID=2594432 RepID=A0ABY3CQ28_9FLAO|nr:glycosyltransferase family 2 protein [Flavobacterium gawalongense]TRX04456.1 glycosyltransferase [Flavobacterium gawalongense]TRX10346.1 glycosyltransferase [Flavobacterium gawalongense]